MPGRARHAGARQIYGDDVNERHRHRYEVNNIYLPQLEATGYVISARTPSENLPEIMELPQACTRGSSACSSTRSSRRRRGTAIRCSSFIQAALRTQARPRSDSCRSVAA